MPQFLSDLITPQLFVSMIMLAVMANVILVTIAFLIYCERKISAYMQDRLGPNRVGFDFGLPFLKALKGKWGLGQSLADGLKLLLKEDFRPRRTELALFTIAPIMIIVPALIGFVIIPWGGRWDFQFTSLPLLGNIGQGVVHVAGAHVNAGVIYLLAVASLGVYGITIGGWASNNKYSFLGGMRATAQMISYEIPLGLSLLAVLLVYGSFMPEEIIEAQRAGGWGIIAMPLAAVLFFICALAESNRAPFDNAEAEQELVGGYHTEYSSMRFALFLLAEYAHMITGMAFFTLLFLGGWQISPIPGVAILPEVPEGLAGLLIVLLKIGVFFGKVVLLVCFQIVIRWTIPRLRYDQIMMLGWQSLIPIGLVMVVAISVLVHLGWDTLPVLLLTNVVLIAGVLAGQNRLPRSTANRRIPLYGSRFSPVPGESVSTAPTDPMALEDRPIQGTAPAAS